MDNTLFTAQDIFSAYKKFKHYFYYDNTSMFVRGKIAQFEQSIGADDLDSEIYKMQFWNKMNEIANNINGKSDQWWRVNFKKNISLKITPKSFHKNITPILTNRTEEKNIQLKRVNIFIDADIEVHIISVLWLMYVGKYMSSWIDSDNYAYNLEIDGNTQDEQVVNGLRLYKPYFIQYQNWRDKAIEKAEQLFEEKKDVVILSLDIKDYFHSVKVNLSEIERNLSDENQNLIGDFKIGKLFSLLRFISKAYTEKVGKIKSLPPDLKPQESILPIGLLSSGLLGNLYLTKFDRDAKEKLNPSYYGRYVDDILFVLTNVSVKQNVLSPVNYFIDQYFIQRDLLRFHDIKEIPDQFKKRTVKTIDEEKFVDYNYKEPEVDEFNDEENFHSELRKAQNLRFIIASNPTLQIQSQKVILQDLNAKESPAILNNFKKNLDKNRSEFRFLPDEEQADREFDEEAFSIRYNDSINKLRSIKELNEDKYGASKYLAGKIFSSNLSKEKPDLKTTTQILTFFKGVTSLNFHTLWEKVATYFIINEQPDALTKFLKQSINAIKNIKLRYYEENNDAYVPIIEQSIQQDMMNYLFIAVGTPLAYNLSFLEKVKYAQWEVDNIYQIAKAIRISNMIRHAWIGISGINFTNYLFSQDLSTNLLKISPEDIIANVPVIDGNNMLSINTRLQLLAPRYVHFHEMNILEIYKTIHSIDSNEISSIKKIDEIPDKAFVNYWKLNQEWKFYGEINPNFDSLIEKNKESYFTITSNSHGVNNLEIGKIVSITSAKEDKISPNKKVAIANIKINPQNVKNSFLGSPNTDSKRRKELFDLINLVEEERCDLFVLPEVSVPYQWMNLLAYQSFRRNIAIIAGLEH